MGLFAEHVSGLEDYIRKTVAKALRERSNVSFTDTHSLAEHLHPQADADAEAKDKADYHAALASGNVPRPTGDKSS